MTKYEKLEKELGYLKKKLDALEKNGDGNVEIIPNQFFKETLNALETNGSFKRGGLEDIIRRLMRSLFLEEFDMECYDGVVRHYKKPIRKVEQMTFEQAQLGKEFIYELVQLYNLYLDKAELLRDRNKGE